MSVNHPIRAIIVAGISLAASFGASAQPTAPVIDFGVRQQDEVYPLSLVARNLNCRTPQDFRFDLSGAPFVVALADPVVRQVPPGGEGSTPAELVFSLVPPGPQQGVITTICETCRPIPVFGNNCRQDKQQVMLSVMINPTPQPGPSVEPTPMPGAPGELPSLPPIQDPDQPPQPGSVEPPQPLPPQPQGPRVQDFVWEGYGPGAFPEDGGCPVETDDYEYMQRIYSDPALERSIDPSVFIYLKGGQQKALESAHKKAAEAEAAAIKAREDLEQLKKKKKDCWEELAALRAEQAAKEAAADAAEAAAEAAQEAVDKGPERKAVDDAQKAVDNFQDDVDKAQQEFDRWTEAAQRQQDYLETVIAEEGGLTSKRGQNAKKYYEDAAKKREDARANLDKVKNSMAERQAALAQAQQALAAAQAAADAKKQEAADARAAADAAKAAADAKERECLGLDNEVREQEKAAAAVDKAAKDAGAEEKKAEALAAKQAKENAANALACKKDDCERIQKMWDDYFRKLTNAQKALEQLGYFNQQEAPPPQPKDAWADYKKLGYTTFMKVAAKGAGLALPGGVPTAGNVQLLLPILQAAYGIAGIRQSALTPGTYAHGRTEGAELRDWLENNNFANDAKEAAEVENLMEDLMRNPNLAAEKLAQAISELERCKEELAALQAQAGK
jgi:hypothetical protein